MPQIILTDEQARIFTEAGGPVELRDRQGQLLARVPARGDEDVIAECKRRLAAGGPRTPAARVTAMMQQLQELADKGEATPEKVQEVVRRTKAGGPP